MIKCAKEKGTKIRLHTNATNDVGNFEIDDLHISLNETEFSEIEINLEKLVSKGVDFKIDFIEGISKSIPKAYKKYIWRKGYYNWQGELGRNQTNSSDILCSHPYKSMVVLYNGLCVACCVDYDGKWIIGDAKTESLREIWNSQKMQRIRGHSVTMCRFCNLERLPAEEIANWEKKRYERKD